MLLTESAVSRSPSGERGERIVVDSASSSSKTQDAPRDCGGCNVCCTAMRVTPLDKPAGCRCPNQTEAGCAIYHSRPEVCRSWFCLWVRDDKGVFTDRHRPDRLGLFFTASQPDPQSGRQTVYAHEIEPGSAQAERAAEAIDYLRQFVEVRLIRFKREPAELTIDDRSAA